jgi:uncharacterized damage-inducible protein DinB
VVVAFFFRLGFVIFTVEVDQKLADKNQTEHAEDNEQPVQETVPNVQEPLQHTCRNYVFFKRFVLLAYAHKDRESGN